MKYLILNLLFLPILISCEVEEIPNCTVENSQEQQCIDEKGQGGCSPGSITHVSCENEDPFATVSFIFKQCRNDGKSYDLSECRAVVCADNYKNDDGVCVQIASNQICAPGITKTQSCQSDDPNATLAEQFVTCNSEGTGYIYGNCQAKSCSINYTLDATSGVCKLNPPPQICSPNSTSVQSCQSKDPYAASSEQVLTCKVDGSAFTPGICQVKTCVSNYSLDSSGKCVLNTPPQVCSPSSTTVQACQSGDPNALDAEQILTCKNDGSGYVMGICQIESCANNYNLSTNNSCVLNTPPPAPSPSPVCSASSTISQNCTSTDPYAASASQTLTCKVDGSGYIAGNCMTSTCISNYNFSAGPGSQCIPSTNNNNGGITGSVSEGSTITINASNGENFGNLGPTLLFYEGFNRFNDGAEIGTVSEMGSVSYQGNNAGRPLIKAQGSLPYGKGMLLQNDGINNYRQMAIQWPMATNEFFQAWTVLFPPESTYNPVASGGNTGWQVKTLWNMLGPNGFSSLDNPDVFAGAFFYHEASDNWVGSRISSNTRPISTWDRAHSGISPDSRSPYHVSFWSKGNQGQAQGSDGMYRVVNESSQNIIISDYLNNNGFYSGNTLEDRYDRTTIPGYIRGFYKNVNSYVIFSQLYQAIGPGAAARVEICEALNYDSCRKFGRVIVSSPNDWTYNQITGVVKSGSFYNTSLTGKYIHIFNANNDHIDANKQGIVIP